MKLITRLAWPILEPILRWFLSFFFEMRYLQGRWFGPTRLGYVWALKAVFQKNILRLGNPLPWPSALTCNVAGAGNIQFHPDNLDNFQSGGTYFQSFSARIFIGHGTYIAPNVGIITANHKLTDLDEQEEGRDVVISEDCWIGMNSVILPGVHLGPRTIVAAGSVVTKSFLEGNMVIGGVPAKFIKTITNGSEAVS